jgi:hypothetical protein
MNSRSRKLGVRTRAANHAAFNAFVRVLVLLVIGCGVPKLALAANQPTEPTMAPGRGLPVAIADFDGDHHPDTASVQAVPGGTSYSNDYWVHLHLSASGKRYIRLSAPRGGLLVEALDVNGDHAVDLVFATAWLDRPVAILLNDGHGNFSRVDPSEFPQAFKKSRTAWNSRTDGLFYGLGLPQESPVGDFRLARSNDALKLASAHPYFAGVEFVPSPFLMHLAGRAPPAAILQ